MHISLLKLWFAYAIHCKRPWI